jgi:hypothetical protein
MGASAALNTAPMDTYAAAEKAVCDFEQGNQ